MKAVALGKTLVATAVALALYGCGGGGGGDAAGGGLTLTGKVTDAAIAGATVIAKVGGAEVARSDDPTGVDGSYAIVIPDSVADDARIVLEAEEPTSGVRLVTLAPTAGTLRARAGTGTSVDAADVPELQVTNVSTARYVVMDSSGDGQVDDAEEAVFQAALLELQQLADQLAAAIKTVVDLGVDLGADDADTLAMAQRLASDADALAAFIDDNFDTYVQAREQVSSDATLQAQAVHNLLAGQTYVLFGDEDAVDGPPDVLIAHFGADGSYREVSGMEAHGDVAPGYDEVSGRWSVSTEDGKVGHVTIPDGQGGTLSLKILASDANGMVVRVFNGDGSSADFHVIRAIGFDASTLLGRYQTLDSDPADQELIEFAADGSVSFTDSTGSETGSWVVNADGTLTITDSDGESETLYRLAGSDANIIRVAGYEDDAAGLPEGMFHGVAQRLDADGQGVAAQRFSAEVLGGLRVALADEHGAVCAAFHADGTVSGWEGDDETEVAAGVFEEPGQARPIAATWTVNADGTLSVADGSGTSTFAYVFGDLTNQIAVRELDSGELETWHLSTAETGFTDARIAGASGRTYSNAHELDHDETVTLLPGGSGAYNFIERDDLGEVQQHAGTLSWGLDADGVLTVTLDDGGQGRGCYAGGRFSDQVKIVWMLGDISGAVHEVRGPEAWKVSSAAQ